MNFLKNILKRKIRCEEPVLIENELTETQQFLIKKYKDVLSENQIPLNMVKTI